MAMIDPHNDDFGAICNCAVRYAVGRRTYMPDLVIDFITPHLSELTDKTLWCFQRDLYQRMSPMILQTSPATSRKSFA